MGITILDVAKRANVAVMTASRAMNNYDSVRPYIKERVLAAALELGYTQNQLARGLKIQKVNTVSMTVHEMHNPFFGYLTEKTTAAFRKNGYEIMFHSKMDDLQNYNESYNAAASILLSLPPETVNSIMETRPVTTINAWDYEAQNAPDITIDHSDAYRHLTELLLETGKKHIAFCTKSGSWERSFRRKFRFAHEVLQENGIKQVKHHDRIKESPEDLIREILNNKTDADAVFCENDLIAAKIQSTLLKHGTRCPEDVLIIGCDGTFPIEGMWSVGIDLDMVAEKTAEYTLRQLRHEQFKEQTLIKCVPLTPASEETFHSPDIY